MPKDSTLPLVVTLWETHGSTMAPTAKRVGELLGIPVYAEALSSEDIEELAAEDKSGRGAEAARKLARGTTPANMGSGEAEEAYEQLARKNTEVVKEHAQGGGVIQHRSGAFILRDRPNTLHVRLEGVAARRQRAAKGQPESPLALQWDPKDIVSYDAILNTASADIEETAQFIAVMARVRGGQS